MCSEELLCDTIREAATGLAHTEFLFSAVVCQARWADYYCNYFSVFEFVGRSVRNDLSAAELVLDFIWTGDELMVNSCTDLWMNSESTESKRLKAAILIALRIRKICYPAFVNIS
jgi:hypothetical protein